MKMTFLPSLRLGKWGFALSISFVILISLQIRFSIIPVPVFATVSLGVAGFVAAIVAFIRKDRSIGILISIVIGAVILFVFGSILLDSADFFKGFQVVKDYSQRTEGSDMSGDGMNLGEISQSGDQIYMVVKNRLYRVNSDWTGRTKVTDFPVSSIFISDEWIYFTDDPDISNLYRMKKDGSERTKLSEDNVAQYCVSGDMVLYSTKKSLAEFNEIKKKAMTSVDLLLESEAGTINKMKTDGSEKITLCKVSLEPGKIEIHGEWIYYEDYGKLYKIKIDGTERAMISGKGRFGYVTDTWLYFIALRDTGTDAYYNLDVVRMKIDGSERSTLASLDRVYFFTLDEGWLYFVFKSEKGLHRMRPDGTEMQKLNNINIWALDGVSGNWMYISDYSGARYRVKLDGSVGTRIN
ncbi:MAG TPA: DUF5050 domain-containing protein [Mesotoga infera]|nr:DUF5050 domain-containing protein [Mesotoga sp.]NLI05751.1 DUF5050 domain-containing protein [Thermotogaceae bacterium]HNS67604.1 DUF5050 domain-containing protein [Mesotoga infera]HON27320.1 DUF5050 domain-containing protein [Mesotoga infera]HPD37408.1 DUF5050 domain-containing protein [Mesotoga infera]